MSQREFDFQANPVDEVPVPPTRASYLFNGPEYVPERDNPRLLTQLGRIKTLMLDGVWRTLAEIEDATGEPPASISAQLRHLRKPRHGRYIVNRRHLGGGLYAYQVVAREESAA